MHKRLYERVLGAELTHYLGYGKGEAPQQAEGQRRKNYRNGSSKKTLLSEDGKLEIDIARDRTGKFEPQFIRKGQKRFGGFDAKIIAMYAQGISAAKKCVFPRPGDPKAKTFCAASQKSPSQSWVKACRVAWENAFSSRVAAVFASGSCDSLSRRFSRRPERIASSRSSNSRRNCR
jgi:hypothetical protein